MARAIYLCNHFQTNISVSVLPSLTEDLVCYIFRCRLHFWLPSAFSHALRFGCCCHLPSCSVSIASLPWLSWLLSSELSKLSSLFSRKLKRFHLMSCFLRLTLCHQCTASYTHCRVSVGLKCATCTSLCLHSSGKLRRLLTYYAAAIAVLRSACQTWLLSLDAVARSSGSTPRRYWSLESKSSGFIISRSSKIQFMVRSYSNTVPPFLRWCLVLLPWISHKGVPVACVGV